MRVLVVDQDSASNEAIARSLRDLYTVDAVTNKGDCLDLLRSNTFEVIVAAERLEDGSGLELLGQISKKWPSLLRIFAADRQRLQLLRGRLGPFELFQTLTYPMDPDRLIATLSLAGAAQDANADTSNIQHVVLSGEAPAESSDVAEELAESNDFPAPQPAPRVAPVEQVRAGSRGMRTAARGGPGHRPHSVSGQRPRRNGSATRGGTNRPPPVRFPPLERVPPLEKVPPLEPSQGSRSNSSRADSFAEAAALARAARSNYESPSEDFDSKHPAIMIGGGIAVAIAVAVLGFKVFGSKTELPHPAPPIVHAPQYPKEVTDLIAQTEAAFKADDYKSARADVDRLRQLSPSHPRLGFFEGLLVQHADGSKGRSATSPNGSKRNGPSSKRGSNGGSMAAAGSAGPPSTGTSAANPRSAASGGTASAHGSPTSATRGSSSSGGSVASTNSAVGSSATIASSGGGLASQGVSSGSGTGSDSPVPPGFAPPTPPGFSRAPPASTEGASADTSSHTPVSTPTSGLTSASGPAGAAGPAHGHSTSVDAAPAPIDSTAPTHAAAPATRRSSSSEPPPVIQEAKVIRRVSPDYPPAAKRDGIEGSVDLQVTVSAQGIVEDISVIQSTPPDLFDKSALAAVKRWRYDPRYVDGLPSTAHLKVHLDFGPDK